MHIVSSALSSTEKLLHTIRASGASSADFSGPSFATGTTDSKKQLKGKAVIGIKIAQEALELVWITHTPKGPLLTGFWNVPYEEGSVPKGASNLDGIDDTAFSSFLSKCYARFSRGSSQIDVWALIGTEHFDMWIVRIPKVPPARMSTTVYWAAQKAKKFNPQDLVMDYSVLGEVIDSGVTKLEVLIYTAPRTVLAQVQGIYESAGIPLAGVTFSSFAFQSLVRSGLIPEMQGLCASVSIGDQLSRIDLFNEGNLVLSRGINTGVSSLISEFRNACNKHINAEDGSILYDLEEDAGSGTASGSASGSTLACSILLTREQAREVFVGTLLDQKISAELAEMGLKDEQVLDMAGAALSRLMQQIERTFDYYKNTLQGKQIEKIFFAGAICSSTTLMTTLTEQLEQECYLLDPLAILGNEPTAPNLPAARFIRLANVSACGLGMSTPKTTPNLLYTYEQKDKARQTRWYTHILYACFLVLFVVLTGYWIVRHSTINAMEALLAQQQQQIAGFRPVVDKALLEKTTTRFTVSQRRLKKLSKVHEGLAILSEVAALTPDNIKLLSASIELGSPLIHNANPSRTKNKKPRFLLVEGIIQGAAAMHDAQLAAYLARMQHSVLLHSPRVDKRELEEVERYGNVMHFVVQVQVH